VSKGDLTSMQLTGAVTTESSGLSPGALHSGPGGRGQAPAATEAGAAGRARPGTPCGTNLARRGHLQVPRFGPAIGLSARGALASRHAEARSLSAVG
jgi:hypothetical protein